MSEYGGAVDMEIAEDSLLAALGWDDIVLRDALDMTVQSISDAIISDNELAAIIEESEPDYFQKQKSAFLQIPPLLLAEFSGRWIVSRDGQIVDSDPDLQVLSRRFFDANGDVDVYIVKIDQRLPSRIRTPFLRRRQS